MAGFGALLSLQTTLQHAMVEHFDLISKAKMEFDDLQKEIQVLMDFVEKSADKGEGSQRDIIYFAYQAEDIIEDYFAQAVIQNSKSSCLLRINRIVKGLKLRYMLKALRKQRLRPLLGHVHQAAATPPVATSDQPEEDAQLPLVRQHEFVGFEDKINELIKCLFEKSDQVDVIPIVGMGGSGKTALAWKAYDDPIIQREFQNLMWISVSQDYNLKTVLLTILKQFTKEDASELSNSLLAEIVRNNLENCRFLLVMDDVWTTEALRLIEFALPMTNGSGKVIITTQVEQVAMQANQKRDPIRMRSLTCQESWELLQLKAFGTLKKCPPKLEEIGKQIAVNCQGLPLATVTIGGILSTKDKLSTSDMIDEWERVSSTLCTVLQTEYAKHMKSVVARSYDKLSYKLKHCFLYLGAFPEGTAIPTWKLIRLWIAEGFIQAELGKSLEEVAEENLKHLIDRNLVMVDEIKAGGGVKTCRLPDIVHEFCRSLASCEVKRSSDGTFNPPISEIANYHRLSIHSCIEDFIRQKPKGRHVRSFLCFSNEAIILQPDHVSAITEAFPSLRVLDMNPIKFSKVPINFACFEHLRYITMSVDHFNALPGEFLSLWNLQTIRIDTKMRTFEIKGDIWETNSNLRHIWTKAAIVMNMEAKGRAGKNLQTLNRLSMESLSEGTCRRASNLKSLGIRGNLMALLTTNVMARLGRLEKLKLFHDVYPNSTSENPLIRLPSPKAFPPYIMNLKLSSTFLEWRHMSTLGMLPTLEILKLKDNAFVGMLWEVNDGLFPSLEVLLIDHTNLEVWSASEDSFPGLRCLVLKNCEKLNEIPLVLAKNLQALDIKHVTKSAVISARRIQEEKLKMQDQKRAIRGEFKLNIGPGDEITKRIQEEKLKMQDQQRAVRDEFKLNIGPGDEA